ncbi:mon2p [Saccharomyces arboricola H-6]|uniref:Mon2p n=1 Tax=Saccharomyces arboricola (strain H-6 / AS 2.3317 / CBS 10644) TaxID=1160507 RepID=J8Q0C7_SACAR|nr:mon2p [Saccharomyces arboricola H-6]
MTMNTGGFSSMQKQLEAELRSLSSESKRRNSTIRHASDKSVEILKRVHSFEELERHPDFVQPFVLACQSRNAKMTTLAMQCLQGLSTVPSIPRSRLSEILDAFIEATHLAMEIQLKVLQVVPIFFKTYGRFIYGPLCRKLLLCCSNLLHVPNKAPVVVGTASATLQQLIDEIFDRLSIDSVVDDKEFEVLISNSETTKVNVYRYDANKLFDNICSLNEINASGAVDDEDVLLDIGDIPIDYGLEILESILKNSQKNLLGCEDLQYLLRVKAIPLLLRCISSSKHFSTAVRSCRCLKLLIRKEFLSILELELEVILSLLIHGISVESNLCAWQRVLSLELFKDLSQYTEIVNTLYMDYDNYPDKKHVFKYLLKECIDILNSPEYITFLAPSEIVEKMDAPLITTENSTVKTKFMHLLDKSNAPSINITYVISLILVICNHLCEGLSKSALDSSPAERKFEDKEHENGPGNDSTIVKVYSGLFSGLFELNKLFLHSTSLETPMFHSVVRAFQKLAHSAGVLSLEDKLRACMKLFSILIANNVTSLDQISPNDTTKPIRSLSIRNISGSRVLNGPGETTRDKIRDIGDSTKDKELKRRLHPRNINSRQVSLLRALVSLSISLGPVFDSESWKYTFLTWQWVSYYIYGPSADFKESFYLEDIPPPPMLNKSDVTSIESSLAKFFESTSSYSCSTFHLVLTRLILDSKNTLTLEQTNLNIDNNIGYHPLDTNNEIMPCIYNKAFFVNKIGELATYNCKKFLAGKNGKELWSLLSTYMIKLISNREMENDSLRLYSVRVFTDIIKKAANQVGNSDEQEDNIKQFGTLENLIIDSLMATINSIKQLDVGKQEIYNGTINVESDILFQLLLTLKEILNEFGELLMKSWTNVFNIINSPFEWTIEDADLSASEDIDDSSLFEGIIQKHKNMIQVSYDVFKLISDDFLQSLPMNVIKCVINTLVNFVTQKRNLNISFSSISQFWLVGDYLRVRFNPDTLDLNDERHKSFAEKIRNQKLIEIITSDSSHNWELYNGLWIYLLKNLMNCTNDDRIEVKNGAVQTFFRIIDSHSVCFPPWNLIFLEVIEPLLTKEWSNEELENETDFINITLQGLIKLYPEHFKDFKNKNSCAKEWSMLLNFLKKLLLSTSNNTKHTVILNYQTLLEKIITIENVPYDILQNCCEIFTDYNITYSDLSISTSNKTEYDCLYELIAGFPFLYQLISKYDAMTDEFVEKVLLLFNSAIKYPLLPEFVQDKTKPSSMQKAILSSLDIFTTKDSEDTEILVLLQLSTISILAFDTREKIEKKLGPKLPKSLLNRLPTFEAISYMSCTNLRNRVAKIDEFGVPTLKAKHILRILKNLTEIIKRKSLIAGPTNDEIPVWVLASNCFSDLSNKILKSLHKDTGNPLKDNFCDLFINVIITTLQRISPELDNQTEIDDLNEYSKYREILLSNEIISLFSERQLDIFISAVWNGSFLYEFDELENALMKDCGTFAELSSKLSTFDFSSLFGSTTNPHFLTKYKCSIECLQDLVNFMLNPNEKLRKLTAPYLSARIALALRRYISDEYLIGRAPIPKLRKTELATLLNGLCGILRVILDQNSSLDNKRTGVENLQTLSPLILRTIPVSHKMDGLQDKVLELSLDFTKLD